MGRSSLQMLLHLLNHATYRLGQVVTMLRQLDKEAPSTDFLLFYDELRDKQQG